MSQQPRQRDGRFKATGKPATSAPTTERSTEPRNGRTRCQIALKWLAKMEADPDLRDEMLATYGRRCPCRAVGNRGDNVKHGGKCEAVVLYRERHSPPKLVCQHTKEQGEEVGVLFGKPTARCECGEYVNAETADATAGLAPRQVLVRVDIPVYAVATGPEAAASTSKEQV